MKCHGPIKPKGKLNLGSPRSMARGGVERAGRRAGPARREHALGPGRRRRDAAEARGAALGRPRRRPSAAGSSTGPRACPTPPRPPGRRRRPITGRSRRRSHPRPPPVRDGGRVRGPVDRFIQRALEDRGLTLGPDADRATLIRRLSFDLTGLPPTPEEIAAFVDDPRPDAYERLVDRLLASPRYGERWGKHWLDAAGYADSNGYFSADTDRPLAYRYRDYVIRAFNADRPLDQIVREQLAGDELAGYRRGPGTPPEVIDQLVATHFLRNGQDGTGESDGNPDEVRADKYAVLEGTVQIIGSSLLGLTIQCAECHDHKFEPVTQKEYYRLQAILYPAFNVEHWVKPNDRVVIAGPRDELLRWEAHDKAIDAEIAALKRTFVAGPDSRRKKAKEKALKPVIEAIEGAAAAQPRPDRLGRRRVERAGRDPDPASGATPRTPGREGRPGRSGLLDRPGQPLRAGRRRGRARARPAGGWPWRGG